MSQILPAYPDQPWFQSAAPASRYRKIAVERVSGACGAVISGANGSRLDLARADAETIAEIKLALLDAGAVFFRDQGHLTNAEYEKFASNFGAHGVSMFLPRTALIPFFGPRFAFQERSLNIQC